MSGTALRKLTPLVAGLLFGTGLSISGMVDPQKVLGFLDFAGAWNPQLAFVMGGALLITLPAFWWAERRGATLAGEPLSLPPRTPITKPLVIGAAVFGLGWGLSGVCPGPALLLATGGQATALIFLLALLAGAAGFTRWSRRSQAGPRASCGRARRGNRINRATGPVASGCRRVFQRRSGYPRR